MGFGIFEVEINHITVICNCFVIIAFLSVSPTSGFINTAFWFNAK